MNKVLDMMTTTRTPRIEAASRCRLQVPDQFGTFRTCGNLRVIRGFGQNQGCEIPKRLVGPLCAVLPCQKYQSSAGSIRGVVYMLIANSSPRLWGGYVEQSKAYGQE